MQVNLNLVNINSNSCSIEASQLSRCWPAHLQSLCASKRCLSQLHLLLLTVL